MLGEKGEAGVRAPRRAFVSGSARRRAFAREMPRAGVDVRLNSCPFAPVNELRFLKC